ncbi:MAG: hypothetical protein KDB62_02300 [Solirubrobacterales bacterium]|nr:hypothetical protein [Solirubrobacterales bacterium]
MLRQITVLLTIVALGVALPASATAGGQIDAPPKLRLKLTTPDGKKKVKVAKKLKVISSCTNDCRLTAKIKLITPASNVKGTLSNAVPANRIYQMHLKLTGFGLRYLKKNYRKSRLKVKLTAVDALTGEKAIKSKTFRFRK